MRLNDLALLDQVVLALLDEEPRHGFAVAKAFSDDEALVIAITVRRPLVYRSIDALAAAQLITAARVEVGQRGANRTIYRTTARGRQHTREWLDAVVPHPRDARLELLAKFALRARRGMSNRALAATQRQRFEPMSVALREARGDANPTADLVRRWRYESLTAMVGLLRELENA
jgi:DNA-binding PadR family transcriptional regulator